MKYSWLRPTSVGVVRAFVVKKVRCLQRLWLLMSQAFSVQMEVAGFFLSVIGLSTLKPWPNSARGA